MHLGRDLVLVFQDVEQILQDRKQDVRHFETHGRITAG